MNYRLPLPALALLLFTAACTSETSDEDTASADSAESTSKDSADRGCTVMLRTASVDFEEPSADGRWFVLHADVDVLQRAPHAKPALRWVDEHGKAHSTSDHDDAPTAVNGAAPGFQRYRFAITHDTIAAQGTDSTLIASSHVAIIPFVTLSSGERLFDHNRVGGAFDTYTLWGGDTAGGLVPAPANNPTIGARFSVKNAASVCAHAPAPRG